MLRFFLSLLPSERDTDCYLTDSCYNNVWTHIFHTYSYIPLCSLHISLQVHKDISNRLGNLGCNMELIFFFFFLNLFLQNFNSHNKNIWMNRLSSKKKKTGKVLHVSEGGDFFVIYFLSKETLRQSVLFTMSQSSGCLSVYLGPVTDCWHVQAAQLGLAPALKG